MTPNEVIAQLEVAVGLQFVLLVVVCVGWLLSRTDECQHCEHCKREKRERDQRRKDAYERSDHFWHVDPVATCERCQSRNRKDGGAPPRQ